MTFDKNIFIFYTNVFFRNLGCIELEKRQNEIFLPGSGYTKSFYELW